jgi:hypothetical protein
MANLCAIEFFWIGIINVNCEGCYRHLSCYPGPMFVDDVVVIVAGFPEVTTNPYRIPDFKIQIIISSYLLSMVDRDSKNSLLSRSGSVNQQENSRVS